MSLILSLETAISVCSIALHSDGELIGHLSLHQDNIHGQKLMPAISSLLDQVGIRSEELSAIAISAGPGSYTGLRIGVSTAKGLAYANDLPLIAVDTLDALAYRLNEIVAEDELIIPIIDARRMEVYQKVLNGRMEEISPLHPLIIDESSFTEYLEVGKVYFLGDAVKKVKEVIQHPNAHFVHWLNSAVTVGELAHQKFRNNVFEDLAYFEPNYLKEFRVITSKKNPLLS